MNLRALTRGDAAVAGAAVLLFVSSFLPYRTVSVCILKSCSTASNNAWESALFPLLPAVFLLGVIAAGLTLAHRLLGAAVADRQILGLRMDQWGTALSVAAFWSALWAMAGGGEQASDGLGAWLALLATLVLAGAAAAGPLVPALKEPLLPEPSAAPAAPQGYQGYPQGAGLPGQAGQPGQYGYPAQAQAAQAQAYGGEQQGGYGYPGAAQAAQVHAAPAQTAVQPAVLDQAPQAQAAPFQPFWFAVPAVRQLANKDNPAAPPVGELVPGTWYLAVEQRGAALVAQLQDGSHGLLVDTSGIQRG